MIIDWPAVEFVVEGEHMKKLTPTEKRMVIRRLSHKILTAHDDHQNIPPGKLTITDLAARMGCAERTVEHTITNLAPAVKGVCPVCGTCMWVHETGTVEPHCDRLSLQCPLDDKYLLPMHDDGLLALQVVWVAQWMRADPYGMQAYLSGLGGRDRGRLLAAALAAVPVDTDPAKLFEWVS